MATNPVQVPTASPANLAQINRAAAPRPTGAVPPSMRVPLGGLDLPGLAAGARAENQTRLAGQQDQVAGYLNQILGEQGRTISAQTERDKRMAEFQRAQQIAAASADSSLQGQQIAAQQQQGLLSRGFQGDQAAQSRAFELGQAATRDPLKDYAAQRAIDAQYQVAQASLDHRASLPQLQDFGTHEINPDRGYALEQQDPSLYQTVTSGPQWQDDLEATRKLIQQYGYTDPTKLVQKVQQQFGNRDRSASLALFDLGYQYPTAAG